jgi:hypothetical protein
VPPTAIDDPCRLFRPRPFPERLWAFLCAPATGVADRLNDRQDRHPPDAHEFTAGACHCWA